MRVLQTLTGLGMLRTDTRLPDTFFSTAKLPSHGRLRNSLSLPSPQLRPSMLVRARPPRKQSGSVGCSTKFSLYLLILHHQHNPVQKHQHLSHFLLNTKRLLSSFKTHGSMKEPSRSKPNIIIFERPAKMVTSTYSMFQPPPTWLT